MQTAKASASVEEEKNWPTHNRGRMESIKRRGRMLGGGWKTFRFIRRGEIRREIILMCFNVFTSLADAPQTSLSNTHGKFFLRFFRRFFSSALGKRNFLIDFISSRQLADVLREKYGKLIQKRGGKVQ
jgi:hypothetical protein